MEIRLIFPWVLLMDMSIMASVWFSSRDAFLPDALWEYPSKPCSMPSSRIFKNSSLVLIAFTVCGCKSGFLLSVSARAGSAAHISSRIASNAEKNRFILLFLYTA